jgi:hypothetical protein
MVRLFFFVFFSAMLTAGAAIDDDSTRQNRWQRYEQKLLSELGKTDTTRALVRHYVATQRRANINALVSGSIGAAALAAFSITMNRQGTSGFSSTGGISTALLFTSAFVAFLLFVVHFVSYSEGALRRRLRHFETEGRLPKYIYKSQRFQRLLEEEKNRN